MKKTQELNPRQAKFIDAYLLDPCATRAAKEAGYSERSAYSIGSGLLKNPLVAETIKRERSKMNDSTGLERDRIISELWRVSRKYDRLKQGSVVVKALALLGKMEGSLDDRVKAEITGKNGGPIETKNYEDLTDDELTAKLQRSLDRIHQAGRVN